MRPATNDNQLAVRTPRAGRDGSAIHGRAAVILLAGMAWVGSFHSIAIITFGRHDLVIR